jgi:tricorn protease
MGISTEGGNPSPDLPRAANGKFSPDGLQFVYEQILREHGSGITEEGKIIHSAFLFKGHLGKTAEISILWMDNTIYFLSDRDFGMNIWAYDITTKQFNRKLSSKRIDCKNLEGDNETLIFENGGYLYISS